MADLAAPRRNGPGRPFQKGQSGNPAGRAPGFRQRLAEGFVKTMFEDFTQHGQAAVDRVREEDPSTYLKVVAGLVPKEMALTDPEGGPIAMRVEFITARPGTQEPNR